MNEIKCSSPDDFIINAYNYAKMHSCTFSIQADYKCLRLELLSYNVCFWIGANTLRSSYKNKLYKSLQNNNIFIIDFINKQLMSFI